MKPFMHKLILAGALVYSSISLSDTTIYTSDTEGLLSRIKVMDESAGQLTSINSENSINGFEDKSHLPLD